MNAVLGPLGAAAKRLRAVVVHNFNTGSADEATVITRADEVAANRDRIYGIWPGVSVATALGNVGTDSAAYAAGLIARMDNERGFWWSPSNQTIAGIGGVVHPVDFALGDSSSLADILNGEHIATIVRKDGFRLWGNRTLEKTDPKWRFLSVRRIADILNDTLLENHLWAVDRNITRTYLENVTDGVNAFIRQLQAQGAILGGRCLPNPDLNTPESIALGHVHFDFEFTPATPAEKITFRSALVNDYIEEIL
ncbi:MAG: phage tail sheath subtilisin-like domain-containing protein [Opitutales bacterium]|nr:phage tail sheath subtilisin-like domain-containing protein [Opitutales bacterium]